MKTLLSLIQFLPLTLFVSVARYHGFEGDAWALAFQWGAVAAALELAILIPMLGSRMSRLIAGANLFLLVGGAAFYFKISFLLSGLAELGAAGLIVMVGVACGLAFFMTPTGVFEKTFSKTGAEKKYSIYFLIGIVSAFVWSFFNRENTTLGGVFPFIFLIGVKHVLQKRLTHF